ncbi:MAG: asparagine synthase (glutamine-hydrolyzing), partial [Clostridia bacterium]|nr:asparagine synthase (glutamine-hydrolyzing) [Clostridia bacterium]
YMLVFNGEIFNFIEVRSELEQKGYTFVSDSDSEVLLASYIEWGSKCLEKFNGMWAFAIWDREKKELFMSRDRFGVKPLFYTCLSETDQAYAFASEMKALTPLMTQVTANRELVMNPQHIVSYESTEQCVINGIKRFPAGSYAYINQNGMTITKWWDTLDHIPQVPKRYEEQVEMFRELFLDACKLRMRSDVTIGTALSGGLDSSATICAMAHLSKNDKDVRMNHDWQHAFVATFPGTTMDESLYARKVTDFLGIQSTFVEIDPGKAIDQLNSYLYLFEDVYLTSPIPMMMLYHSLREHGTLVTIDGHGADELFGGYTFDFIHALKDAGLNKKDIDMILTAYLDSFPNDGSNMALASRSKLRTYLNYVRRDLVKHTVRRDKLYKSSAAGRIEYQKFDTLNKILYTSSHETILPTLLRNYDRYSMASGVEIRMPFMDYRIVSMAFALDWRSKLHGGYSKAIIRDAMAPFMPKEIAYRKTKIGFNTPIVEWMQGPLKAYFEDMINSSSFSNCDLIKPEPVREQVKQVLYNEHATFAMGEAAWCSIYPYLWEQAVLKAQSI